MRGILTVLIVFSAPAFACEAVINKNPSNIRITGEGCAAEIRYGETSGAFVSEVKDLGNGFLVQDLLDGDYCSGAETAIVIQDCNSGRAAIFGGQTDVSFEIDTDDAGNQVLSPQTQLMEKIEASALAEMPMTIEAILVDAKASNVPYSFETATSSTIAMNGRKFPLSCGCKTVYPGLLPADG